MQILQQLPKLKSYCPKPTDRVLTIYLNTEPDSTQQSAWKIRLKNGLKRLREYTEAEGIQEQVDQFDKLQPQVEKWVDEQRNDLKKGLILSACSSGELLFLDRVQIPVPNAFYWSEKPMLEDFEALLKQYPAMGIIQIGSENATVLDTCLGEILKETRYEWDIDQESWKEMRGLAHSNKQASSASHKDQFNKRLRVNRQRWLKDFCSILKSHERKNKWDEVVLTGETSLTSEMTKTLQPDSYRVLNKNLNGMPNPQVLKEVYSFV
ncbi:VLRF1 family aeRF1-type release factor [Paenibacillus abyssi]|uniref:Uncharacterized protein n=2 Tax=Paenibacillus abyssi TaxID=1340531 RepID=A0A917G6H7_9BACL|nr:VLRF1 family aeRF1-type release factor [Paenibacillus abyssi]GGG25294.1 hypothetical protein GCM10010916_47180 [Paenibacillus abyssi]